MPIYSILYIVHSVALSILFLSISILAIYTIKYLKNKNDSLDFTATMSTDIDLKCIEILDSIIKDTFDEYILMNISLNSEKNMYINTETETKIYTEVANNVLETLGPTLLQKLTAIYSLSHIPVMVANKVYFMTTEYVVNNNSLLQDEE